MTSAWDIQLYVWLGCGWWMVRGKYSSQHTLFKGMFFFRRDLVLCRLSPYLMDTSGILWAEFYCTYNYLPMPSHSYLFVFLDDKSVSKAKPQERFLGERKRPDLHGLSHAPPPPPKFACLPHSARPPARPPFLCVLCFLGVFFTTGSPTWWRSEPPRSFTTTWWSAELSRILILTTTTWGCVISCHDLELLSN